jgi:hypothetical protein
MDTNVQQQEKIESSIKSAGKSTVAANLVVCPYEIEVGLESGRSVAVDANFPAFPSGKRPLAAWVSADFEGVDLAEIHFAIQGMTQTTFSLWITNCFDGNRWARGKIKVIFLVN